MKNQGNNTSNNIIENYARILLIGGNLLFVATCIVMVGEFNEQIAHYQLSFIQNRDSLIETVKEQIIILCLCGTLSMLIASLLLLSRKAK